MDPFPYLSPLVVDASSPLLQVGIPNKEGWHHVAVSEKQALEGLFAAAEEALKKHTQPPSEIDAIFFCEGPGSTLGLRIACAFTRTMQWNNRPTPQLYKYNALDMAYVMSGQKVSIQAPFRRGYRFVRQGEQSIGQKEIFTEEEALKKFPESMHLPDPRKLNSSIPEKQIITYNLASNCRGLIDLLRVSQPCEIATPYSPRPAEFKKWKRPANTNR